MNLKYFYLWCLLACLSLPVCAVDYPPSGVNMTLKKVSQHVYYVQGKAGIATDNEGFISNASVVITNKGIVIIDALGSPSLAQLLIKKIREITKQAIIKVIITHYHADHIYGLQVFKALGAHIIAPEGYTKYLDAPIAQERLEERRVSLKPWVNADTRLVIPDEVINGNISFSLGDVVFELNFLGNAHSDGDLSVLIKPDNVLISGDLIFEGRIPFTGNADTRHWLALLEKLDNSHLYALIPGHGGVADDADAVIQLNLHYLQTVRLIMRDAVEEMVDFDEAYKNADWSEFEKLPAFEATHRRNVYGVYLSLEHEFLNQE